MRFIELQAEYESFDVQDDHRSEENQHKNVYVPHFDFRRKTDSREQGMENDANGTKCSGYDGGTLVFDKDG